MENRRNEFRHIFPLNDQLRVELASVYLPRMITGQVVDLSVAGMAVDLGEQALWLREGIYCLAHFNIPHGLRHFALESQVISTRQGTGHGRLGLYFLPLPDLERQEERERLLWEFLLDEQRRVRQQMPYRWHFLLQLTSQAQGLLEGFSPRGTSSATDRVE